MPGQNNRNGQMPQMPNQNGQQQMPGKGGRNGFRGGNNTVRTEKLEQWLAQLVTDGVITQEVSDAILTHVKEQIAQAQAGTETPAESTDPPAEAVPESNPEEQLLKEMLDSGVITQEQYDQYAARFSVPEVPEIPEAGTAGT